MYIPSGGHFLSKHFIVKGLSCDPDRRPPPGAKKVTKFVSDGGVKLLTFVLFWRTVAKGERKLFTIGLQPGRRALAFVPRLVFRLAHRIRAGMLSIGLLLHISA